MLNLQQLATFPRLKLGWYYDLAISLLSCLKLGQYYEYAESLLPMRLAGKPPRHSVTLAKQESSPLIQAVLDCAEHYELGM